MIEKPFSRIWICGVDWVGDVLFSTALVRALRKSRPDAFIAYSAPPSCLDILKGNPHIDEILAYSESNFVGDLVSNIRFIRRLRRTRFDACILLHRSATRASLALAAGIGERVGFWTRKRKRILTRAVTEDGRVRHRADHYLRLLEPMGVRPDGSWPDYFILEEDRVKARDLMESESIDPDRPMMILHPGANWDLKRWPADRFAQVAGYFAEKDFIVAVCGTRRETNLSDAITARCRRREVVSLCGKTNLRVLGALMERCRMVVSNDSGPLHLAAAIGAPALGLFGPTSALLTGPIGRSALRTIQIDVGCEVPCYFETCHHRLCMERLDVSKTIEAIELVLAGSGEGITGKGHESGA